jgi:hypothetical protein
MVGKKLNGIIAAIVERENKKLSKEQKAWKRIKNELKKP